METVVESREAITPRPSHLDPDVPVSVHPAPDNLGLFTLAHVDVVVARFMHCHQVFWLPIVMVAVNVMEVYTFFPKEGVTTMSTGMVLFA